MERRYFLKLAGCLAGAGPTAFVQAAGSQFVESAPAPVPGIIEIGSRKQLFLDDSLIAWTSRVSKLMGRPRKYLKNPVLVADKAWEKESTQLGKLPADGIQISGQTVIYDEEEKMFKMWYNPWSFFPPRIRPWCYAVSKDGYQWEKPELGIYDYQGSRNNNIVGAYSKSKYFNVFKDRRETDPQKRYKAMGEIEGSDKNGTAIAFSPDGLHWTEYSGNPVVAKGTDVADCPTFLGWDAHLQKYVYYPRPGPPLGTRINGRGFYLPPQGLNPNDGQMRAIGYSESDDFIHWTPTRLMLSPDEKDRVDYQYYQMTVAQDGESYVGLLHMIQTHEQTFDIYLLTSRDGFHWNWVSRELPFLRRGEEQSYDGGYLTPSGPVLHDGTLWIYYGAYSGAHSSRLTRFGHNRMTIALATLPTDRYLGLLAGMDLATVVTRPVAFSGSRLKIDMNASLTGGSASQISHRRNFDEVEVRLALLDEFGGEIEGFTIQRSKILPDSGVQEVAWEGADLKSLQGKAVRLRFEYRNAALYSFQFTE